MPTNIELEMLQALPLYLKVEKTKARIREFINYYGVDGVYVSFSGGKDSTVLLHIVRQLYPDIKAVFVNTGLEYPEIQSFVKTFCNVEIIRPKMRFDEVIKKYGYPVISKEVSGTISDIIVKKSKGEDYTRLVRYKKLTGSLMWGGNKSAYCCEKYLPLLDVDFRISDSCCKLMKKSPVHHFQKETNKIPFIATMASESRMRKAAWLKNGCNAFDAKQPHSTPMAFWTEQDVLQYIKENNLKIASVYGDVVECDSDGHEYAQTFYNNSKLKTTGCNRTGCVFCGFGCHLEKDQTRFQKLKQTHPKQYAYCINGGEFNEDGIWQPNKDGLGMGYVFDRLNELYGNDFIKYK